MNTVVRWDPFRELDLMERSMRRSACRCSRSALPAADIYETESEYVVELEVPGYEEEELTIEVFDHMLTVKGEHEATTDTKEKTYRLHERMEQEFERQVRAPVGGRHGQADGDLQGGRARAARPEDGGGRAEEDPGQHLALRQDRLSGARRRPSPTLPQSSCSAHAWATWHGCGSERPAIRARRDSEPPQAPATSRNCARAPTRRASIAGVTAQLAPALLSCPRCQPTALEIAATARRRSKSPSAAVSVGVRGRSGARGRGCRRGGRLPVRAVAGVARVARRCRGGCGSGCRLSGSPSTV